MLSEQEKERIREKDRQHEVFGGDGTGVAAVIAGGVGLGMVIIWMLLRWVF